MFWLYLYLAGYVFALGSLFYGNRFFKSRDDIQDVPLSQGVVTSLMSWVVVFVVFLFLLSSAVKRLDDTKLGKVFLGDDK